MKAAVLSLGIFAAIFARQSFAQEKPKLVPALGWDVARQGAFPTSLANDAQNNLWVGTEDNGVWRYDPSEKKWTQFTTKDGLGDDDVYALAVDKLNRVWAGHLNHGVSVWNGAKWKNYGLLDGPLGDRVFAIAVCPTDGDIWIATDCGVARYSNAKSDWDYYTRASGLPSNQIQCIAFDVNGNIFLGTQCDGIAMAKAAEKYAKWRSGTGPSQMPAAPLGQGLPSNLINAIIVSKCLTPVATMPVGVATPIGVGGSPDGGKSWFFARGADWEANDRGLANPPPIHYEPGVDRLLAEDWVTCFAEEGKFNRVWIGYRQKGVELRDLDDARQLMVVAPEDEKHPLHIRAILPATKLADYAADRSGRIAYVKGARADAPPLFAVYGVNVGGLKTLDSSTATLEPGAPPDKAPAPFPAAAKLPTAESLARLAERVDAFKKEFKPGEGAYLGDDWRTEGDWVGRYGNSFAMLCGAPPPGVYANEPGYEVEVGIGQHRKDEGCYTYIANGSTENPRVLYDPNLGTRCESELNDGTFDLTEYPLDWEGPDLWVDVKVPDGCHCLSLYFENNDAQKSLPTQLRDYDVQLLPWDESGEVIQKSEPIARARVTDFLGGVYKQFIVCGPARYIVRIGRNRSVCTKLQGVFLDRLSGEPPDDRKKLPGFENFAYGPPTLQDAQMLQKDPLIAAAAELWTKLDDAFDEPAATGLQLPLRIWTYRAAVSANAPEELLAPWRWQMGLWTPADRVEFKKAMAHAFAEFSPPPPQPNEKGSDK